MSCSGSLTSIHFCSVRSVTQKYLEKIDEVNFDKIFNQRLGKLPFYLSCLHSGTARLCVLKRCFLLGFLLFKQYCEEISDEAVPQLSFYEEVCVPRVTSHFRIFTFKIDQGLSTIRWGKRVPLLILTAISCFVCKNNPMILQLGQTKIYAGAY